MTRRMFRGCSHFKELIDAVNMTIRRVGIEVPQLIDRHAKLTNQNSMQKSSGG
jgi:hypothetical protein